MGLVLVSTWLHCPLSILTPFGKLKSTFKTSRAPAGGAGIVACILIVLPTFGLQDLRSIVKVEGETCNNNRHGQCHAYVINRKIIYFIFVLLIYI